MSCFKMGNLCLAMTSWTGSLSPIKPSLKSPWEWFHQAKNSQSVTTKLFGTAGWSRYNYAAYLNLDFLLPVMIISHFVYPICSYTINYIYVFIPAHMESSCKFNSKADKSLCPTLTSLLIRFFSSCFMYSCLNSHGQFLLLILLCLVSEYALYNSALLWMSLFVQFCPQQWCPTVYWLDSTPFNMCWNLPSGIQQESSGRKTYLLLWLHTLLRKHNFESDR